jgi:hypothetical protein
LEIAVIVLLAIVAVVFLLKMRSSPKKNTRVRARKKKSKKVSVAGRDKLANANHFPSVSIQFGASACPAVKALTGKRFLANEAPTVPLENCNSASCTCKYVHHEIRREQDKDRRATSSLRTTLHETSGKPERRHGGKSRRSSPK